MADHDIDTYERWADKNVYDRDGDKIGTVADIYDDVTTGRPEWIAVSTGWFGTNVTFVPIAGSSAHQDGLRVGYDKATVKDAPNAEADGRLSEAEERRLYEHYGIAYEGGPEVYDRENRVDRDYQVPERAGDGEMTVSEEELNVAKQERAAGTVRLRKFVTTEDQTVTVPLRKEKVRIERTPVEGTTPGEISDTDTVEEITLSEEQAVVTKNTVAKEKVRLEKDVVTEQETVHGEVRKEHVEVEGAEVDDRKR